MWSKGKILYRVLSSQSALVYLVYPPIQLRSLLEAVSRTNDELTKSITKELACLWGIGEFPDSPRAGIPLNAFSVQQA